MKRFISWLLILCLLFSSCLLVACADSADIPNEDEEEEEEKGDDGENRKDPDASSNDNSNTEDLHAIVMAAIAKTAAANSYEAKLTRNRDSTIRGHRESTWNELNLYAAALDTDAPVMSAILVQSIMGQSVTTHYFFEEAWMYYTTGDGGYKQKASKEQFIETTGSATDLFAELPKELFNGVKAHTAEGIGRIGTTVKLTVDEATFETIYRDLVVQIVYDIVGDDLSQVTTKDAKIEICYHDEYGYILSYVLSFTCEIGSGDEKAVYVCEDWIHFTGFNQGISTPRPEGYHTFPEQDEG